MAAPTHIGVQATDITGTSGNVTMTGVGAGNMLWSTTAIIGSDTRTFDSSDDNGGTWVSAVENLFSSRIVEIEYAKNVASGDTIVTSTVNTSTSSWRFVVGEISGADTVEPLDVTGLADNTATTSQICAASGEIDTAVNVYVLALGKTSADGTTTKNANFTLIEKTDNTMVQYRTSDSALTDEDGVWTISSARSGPSVIASFKAAAAAAGMLNRFGAMRGGMKSGRYPVRMSGGMRQ